MAATNVAKLLSTFLSNLQSEAWGRGVKLVADATAEIEAEVDGPKLAICLSRLTQSLIAVTGAGGSLSLVTSLESAPDGQGMGYLKVQISAPVVAEPHVRTALEEARAALDDPAVDLGVRHTPTATIVELVVPRARACMTLATGLTAVVVDDDVDTQEFLSEVLRGRGFRVISVNDGFDALVAIERHNPDVVLTDVLMPNMSGLDLVARIKAYRTDLPVVVFSGYRDALTRNVAGLPDKILPKPMTRVEVLRAIDEVLAK